MGPDNHTLPDTPGSPGQGPDKQRPSGRGDLLALLAILGAGVALVMAGHLPVQSAITLLTALLGLYAMYRNS